VSLFSDREWKTKYDSDDRSLIRDFFEPALACAVRYDRTTGYFSAPVLTLAARGVEGLVRNGGRMRLIVGCTLDPPEVEAIARGESLRTAVAGRLAASPLAAGSATEEAALELLSWMVAGGWLEVRVAVPCDAQRRPRATSGLFHEKAGIAEDKTGDRLAFNGSVNETPQGWQGNWESFHVFTSWSGDDGLRRVEDEEEGFARLWNDKAKHCLVIDVPTAVRDDLLRFLPAEGRKPRFQEGGPLEQPHAPEPPPPAPAEVRPSLDLRRLVWGVVRHAPALPGGGERVGEATAAVTPWPHQVRAFQRIYHAWPPRLLIADEVGLGKTIEAGLALRQAWLAGRARRVLILAPKAVLMQWQVELREKFNLSWPIYDGQRLVWPAQPGRNEADRKVGRSEWHLEPFVLTSSQLMRRADRRRELLEEAEPWDLVLLDEAHHARRKGGGLTRDRKPNQLLALMQALRERTGGLLLLTATPMQVDPVEVWDLLSLLGLPEGWTESAFVGFYERVLQPSPSHEDFEALARLFQASEARFGPLGPEQAERLVPGGGRLAARKVLEALRDAAQTSRRRLEADRRRAALRMMRAASPVARLVSRHTRGLLRRYYQAGRITTPIAERDVRDVFVPLSPEERRLYDRVEEYISTTYNQAAAAEKNAVGFVMTTYRRRLASSFAALLKTLDKRLAELAAAAAAAVADEDLPDDQVADEQLDLEEATALEREALRAEERADIESLAAAARRLPVDTKTGFLLRELEALRAAGHRQMLVFTQYTDTVDFLRDRLVEAAFRVMCFSGRGGEMQGADRRWRAVSRDDIKRSFRQGQAEILLCTEAAAEGLNFQFCGALVNYDMPWNPMRVEQRIGRIDRLGQAHSILRIVNLHYEDTVETDVYRALRERIGLFSRFVGRLQPILSSLPRGIQGATLAAPAERGRERQGLVSRVLGGISEAEQAGFDLDELTEADLEEPSRPAPLYSLGDLECVLARAELLADGAEARVLAPREFEYRMPGLARPVRVTADPEYFDEHPGSLELWSPGSPAFPSPDEAASAEEVAAMGGRLAVLLGNG
jgi:superfamily II DNA or RNA helicase